MYNLSWKNNTHLTLFLKFCVFFNLVIIDRERSATGTRNG